MDVSFTNVLEGARQYFQGLPAPSASCPSGSTTTTTTTATSAAAAAAPTPPASSSYDHVQGATSGRLAPQPSGDGHPSQDRDDGQPRSYWTSSPGPGGLRSVVEPYAPQPTRVEVPDTRPPNGSPGDEANTTSSTSLTEMQPSRQRQQSSQKPQSSSMTSGSNPPGDVGGFEAAAAPSRRSPQLHQMQPAPKQQPHSPAPVYQQLNNVVSRSSSSSYTSATEILNPQSTYPSPAENRPPSVPIVAQRTQYYPRYHHPDITKSAPVPFSQGSIYQSAAPPSATSPSVTHRQTSLRPSPAESGSMSLLRLSNDSSSSSSSNGSSNGSNGNNPADHQRHPQAQQRVAPSSYPSTPPVANHVGASSVYPAPSSSQNPGNYRVSSHLHQQPQPQQQQQQPSRSSSIHNQQHVAPPLLHHSAGPDISVVHSSSSSATASNPCNASRYPSHHQSNHIPSPHGHPVRVPSPHLPPMPTAPSPASSSTHLQPQQQQQPSQHHQYQHHQLPSRIGMSSSGSNSSPYPGRSPNPYSTAGPTCHSMMSSPQQMLPPHPSSSSSSSSSASSSCRPGASPHEHQSPQRQSPHVSVMHSPHHTPSPHHHTSSPHHHTPSPHNPGNFPPPQSPTYPPVAPAPISQRSAPPPPHPYSLPQASQQYRGPGYPNPYPPPQPQPPPPPHHQSSYHSYQKTGQSQPPQAFYSQSSGGRSQQYPHLPISAPQSQSSLCSPIGSTVNDATGVNGSSYQPTDRKSAMYNGVADPKRAPAAIGNPASGYGDFRLCQTTQQGATRSASTHNLPPIASVSSYHSNRGARETIGKAQSSNQQQQQQQVHPSNSVAAVSSASSSASLVVLPPRVSEYPMNNHAAAMIPAGDRSGTGGSSARYAGGQQVYPAYATTIAPSHHGSTTSTSSTCVASIGGGGGTTTQRSAATTAPMSRGRPASEPVNRSGGHPHQRDAAGYAYKDYANGGSNVPPAGQSSQVAAGQPISAQPSIIQQPSPRTNGLPMRKRESPLDLSVKTVKTPADSTARDDLDNGPTTTDKQVSSSSNQSCARSNGARGMLPPSSAQPPPPSSYVTYDAARGANGTRNNPLGSCLRASTPQTVCAPKVDFLPDFNSTPLRNHHPAGPLSHARNSVRQLQYEPPAPPPQPPQQQQQQQRQHQQQHQHHQHQQHHPHHHHQQQQQLPHMSTFKKSSLPPTTPIYDPKSSSTSTSYTMMTTEPPPTAPRPSSLRYPPQQLVEPARIQAAATALPTEEYPPDPSKYYHEPRGKFTGVNSAQPLRDRATATKRPAEPSSQYPTSAGPAKQPRLDTWRLAIDKQIQQKLSSAKALHEQQKRQEMSLPAPLPNGAVAAYDRIERVDNSNTDARYHQAYCDKRSGYADAAISVSPALSYGHHPIAKSSSGGVHHPLSQASGSQSGAYAGYKQSQRSSYAQIGAATQPAEPPSNTGADKRVLSLLRNSLENKQQREEQLNSQQPILVNHSQQSFQNKVVAPVEPKANIGRHNLSPFTAASLLERNSNTPPHYKFHVPRAVDSITQETPRSLYGSRVNSSATLPGKEALLGPRGVDNQIHRDKDDGLAAILAAKIRTKAELKQVCPGQFVSKPTTVPSQDVSATPTDLEGSASTSTPQSTGSSAGSPPKLTREKTACLPPRRRLFSRTEEECLPVAATIPAPAPIIAEASAVPARASGFRSSSETSVFDFRESDSEGEMPVLERQTLEEMRRDRKQLSKVQPPVPLNDAMCIGMNSSLDLVKIELKENEKITEPDPFWTATCDKFMEQLRSGDSTKKRGRKKKSGDTAKPEEDHEEESKGESPRNLEEPEIKPEDIKQEVVEVDPAAHRETSHNPESKEIASPAVVKTEPPAELPVKEEMKDEPKDDDEDEEPEKNDSGDDSDELPLIIRAAKKKCKKDESDGDEDVISRKRRVRRGSRIKLESSSGGSSDSSSDDADDDDDDDDDESDGIASFGRGSSVADRLRARKRSATKTAAETEGGMKLRSRDTTPHKAKQQDKETGKAGAATSPTKGSSAAAQKPKPKPLFGDGSDFRPGWEAEVYVYKKSLRMPPRLITVSRPSRFHRLSTSLPDLDPGSPALSVSMDSADVCLGRHKRNADSDLESNYSFTATGLSASGKINDDEEATSSTTVSCPPKTSSRYAKAVESRVGGGGGSIVDLLARKVGTGKKDARRKLKEREKLDKGASKTLPKGSNEPELLPTPSLTPLIATEAPAKAKGKTPVKHNRLAKPINVTDSYLLGYFRKETVHNFRNTFKNNHALPNEFSTLVLKSRTRTETRVLKKQATIREVFGEERPASAPPMQNHAGDTSQDDDDSQNEISENLLGRTRKLKQKVASRLRNVGILRSHKAIINSKRHLLTARKRKDLIKSLAAKKLETARSEVERDEATVEQDEEEEGEEEEEEEGEEDEEEEEEEEEDEEDEEEERGEEGEEEEEAEEEAETEINEPEPEKIDETEIPSKKKLKLRTVRRKFRSGFDYIRKKKKPPKKDDAAPKERKRPIITRPNAECVADIQSEIRTWVIKKGVGETILHRAARLGYTDVTAYCLEKLNSAPSPKDNAGYTPLHEACSRGHLEIAKLLLAYGANASESANGGIRPLHEAAENGATELVRLLLSYGADPLLATYAGQTPLMLAVDTDAYSILEQHLSDVQGCANTPWSFGGPSTIFDLEETGYNPLEDPPACVPEPELEEIEMEVSDVNLPVLFTLTNEADKWVLLQDLMTALKVKSRDALLRQVNPKAAAGPAAVAHRDVMRELKLHDFLEQSRCCHLLSGGERINVRGSKVTLIRYNDKVRSLLNVERVVINLR